jgi:hypothetical protein
MSPKLQAIVENLQLSYGLLPHNKFFKMTNKFIWCLHFYTVNIEANITRFKDLTKLVRLKIMLINF